MSTRSKTKIVTILFKQRYLFLMVMPAILLVLIFNYLPLWGWLMAFKNYSVGQNLWTSDWVGFKHFSTFFSAGDEYFYILRNTLVINIVGIFLGVSTAMTFAILLKEMQSTFITKTVQTVSFFPHFISYVIVYAIASALLAVDSGAINQVLVNTGIRESGVNFLADSRYSWSLVWILGLWKNMGYSSVVYLAAMAGIPQEQYESASIDGAGRFKKIYYITIPNLMGTVVVLLILSIGNLLRSGLDFFFLFTNGLNWSTMEVLDMYVYRYGLQMGDFSYATAVGILLTILSLILIFSANGLSKKYTGKYIL